ncbi:DUF910 family protein [Gemella sp. GH3]|uniref:YqgQ family protein n=1 Tax=unclassified Gemella TaxID=2624949 RepID=UPI0015D07EF8|nr:MULTISPECIES: YqgQ family protein [unclassified Gemella]MBF0713938.1 DUF910 family protein [Gemella sp. GH3.1]NYS50890.1 DUF910 family protein [Gemella sp. GH3]
MINFYDVQQLLKSFDIIIYMKDREHLLQLVEFEIRELYRLSLISQNDFLRAITIIKKERRLIA